MNGSEERIDEGTTSHAEQVVRKLREAHRLLGEGFELPDVLRELEVSEATYHRWRAQYGGMKADVVKRLEEFEAENAKLNGSWPIRCWISRGSRSKPVRRELRRPRAR